MVYMVVLTLTFETTDDFYAVHKYQTMAFIERYPLKYLASENLISNSDLLIDSDGNGVPDGFAYNTATDKTLVNGIAKFTATAQWGALNKPITLPSNEVYYYFARVKSDSNKVVLTGVQNIPSSNKYHTGSGNFEFLSNIQTSNGGFNCVQVSDYRISGFTPIEVDYIGAINITDLVSRGILPSGLTNLQYKEMLDNIFSPQGYRITDSIFNPESDEEVHLHTEIEDGREVLYIALDNYGTLDTSFKLGISQMNGQFTFDYAIADNTT